MKSKIMPIVITVMMIATAGIYFLETSEELEEGDLVKGPFFMAIGATYVPVGFWMLEKRPTPYIIAIIGSVGLIALYVVTSTNTALLGIGADLGSTGIITKILQGGIIIGSVLMLRRYRNSP